MGDDKVMFQNNSFILTGVILQKLKYKQSWPVTLTFWTKNQLGFSWINGDN